MSHDSPLSPTPAITEIQFARLVANVRDVAVYTLSPEGLVSSWNAGAQRFTGYSAGEIIGQHNAIFYTPDERAAGLPAQALAAARASGKFEGQGWRVRKDGTRFWAEVVIDAIVGEDGQLAGFVKIARDISDRREAAEALARARGREAQLRSQGDQYRHLLRLFEQAPGFVCFFRGPEHVYELQNKAHHRLAEYKDIIGKPVRAALPELEGQGFFELLDEVFATGVPYVGRALPLLVNPESGGQPEERFLDLVYQPITDEQGKVVGIFSQGSDVTEQVLAQRGLRAKQAELEDLLADRTRVLEETRRALALAHELQGDKNHLLRLFDQAPGFLCVLTGPDHVFELANQAYSKLVGGRPLIGMTLCEALPETVEQGFKALLDKVFSSGEPFVGHAVPVSLQHGRGQSPITRYLDFIYQPVVAADGAVTGIFVQGNDVTDRKLAQDDLKRYQNELERLVSERTRKLEEAQAALQRSQKLEAIGKLTGGVAHDFNNLLQIIAGNLQLLQNDDGPRQVPDRRLAMALDAVERGAKLSYQLLAFARRQPLQPVVVNPRKVVRSMEDLFRRALGETIEVALSVGEDVSNTLVDRHQLENVILNLVINARDAMPSGGRLAIDIANATLTEAHAVLDPEFAPGRYVMFAFSDTGTGMRPEVLERACEPFFTTKPEGQGTGLGLSMAYGFARQSGGHFRIQSTVGAGTTATLYFPASAEAETEVDAHSGGPVVGGTETILVVEDDPIVQATVVEMLHSLGYQVLKADDADHGLEVLKSGVPVDLLFTDVVMPGRLRSPELAQRARELHPHIEVLFTSGYTRDTIARDGRLEPGMHLLMKPYRHEQLALKVHQLLHTGARATHPAGAKTRGAAAPTPRILIVEDNDDMRHTTSEMFALLGHEADAAATPEEAQRMLESEAYSVLFTDVGLPGMSGTALAARAKQRWPALEVVFVSGFGETVSREVDFAHAVLTKPYGIDELLEVLESVAGQAAAG